MAYAPAYMQRRRGGGWLPTTPGNLVAWWDFSDLSHIWADTAGTTGTTNGGTIARVDDKSGNGWNATQSTAGQRPVRTDNTANGKTAATFTAANSTMLTTANFTLNNACTVIVWVKVFSAGYILDGGTVNTRVIIYNSTANPASAQIYGGTAFMTSSNTVDPATAHMIVGVYNGASSVVRLDGTETSGTNIGNATDTTGMTLGADGSRAGSFFTGNILEVACYSVDIGATQRANAQAYGQTKYGAP